MDFARNVHLDESIEERIDTQWEFYDSHAPAGQKFAVMCIVAPTGVNQKCSEFGIKLFGCFPTLSEANDYAKEVSKRNNAFDYYVMPTQTWTRLPPDVENLSDHHYQEEKLENIKKALVIQREASKKNLEERLLEKKDQVEILHERKGKLTPALKED